jgi:hypothetical protein
MPDEQETKRRPAPGVCIPWEQRVKEYPQILGDPEVVKKAWEQTDMLAYLWIWANLIQF